MNLNHMNLFLLLIIPILLLSLLYYTKKQNFILQENFFGLTKPKSPTLPPPPTIDIKKDDKINLDANKNTMIESKLIPDGGIKPLPMNIQTTQNNPPSKSFDSKSFENIFNKMSCSFYAECPKDHKNMGNLGVNGSNVSLSCNGLLDTKQAKAYAIIKNGTIDKIVVIDEGSGYQPSSKPNITIEGNGNGAFAEALIDDKGHLKIIHIINGGSGYTESPEINIEPPVNKKGCNLCCKLN